MWLHLEIEGLGLVLLGHALWYPPKNQLTLIPAFLITSIPEVASCATLLAISMAV